MTDSRRMTMTLAKSLAEKLEREFRKLQVENERLLTEHKIYQDALEAIVRPDNGMKNGGITCRAIANLALVAVSGRRDD